MSRALPLDGATLGLEASWDDCREMPGPFRVDCFLPWGMVDANGVQNRPVVVVEAEVARAAW